MIFLYLNQNVNPSAKLAIFIVTIDLISQNREAIGEGG
jgi:hypothetical protein